LRGGLQPAELYFEFDHWNRRMSDDMVDTQNNFWREAREMAQWGRHSCLPLGHSCPAGDSSLFGEGEYAFALSGSMTDKNVCPPRTACISRRGVIFVTALWVILILGVLVLMFA